MWRLVIKILKNIRKRFVRLFFQFYKEENYENKKRQ